MRAVFLVKAPLQFLNALEARRQYGLSADDCLLVLMANWKSREQLAKLVEREKSSWGETHWLDTSPLRMKPYSAGSQDGSAQTRLWRNDLFSVVKLRHLAEHCADLDFTFIGDAGNPLMRHFANCAMARETVLLDDGVATLKYARWRTAGNWGENLRASKRLSQFLKRCLLGLRGTLPEMVTFFSVYDLRLPGGDRYFPNRFTFMRESASEVAVSKEVYFLGAPLVEASILNEEELFWHLGRVDAYFNGQLCYVAHRRECPERVRRIGEMFGWKTVLFEFPIEYQLSRVGPRPKLLASFISSALENCQLVFGDKMPVASFRLNHKHFSAAKKPKGLEVEAVYQRYNCLQSESFQVIEL